MVRILHLHDLHSYYISLVVHRKRIMHDFAGTVGVPRQLVIKKDPSSIPDAVSKAGLRLPLGMFAFFCSVLSFYLPLLSNFSR